MRCDGGYLTFLISIYIKTHAGGAMLAEPVGPEPAGGPPAHDGDAAGRRDVVRD